MADGHYCEICGAICNDEQNCKHYPKEKMNNKELSEDVEILKDLFNIK